MVPSKSKRMKEADKQAAQLEAEIVPMLSEVEEAAVEDVVEHVSGVLHLEEHKVETERRLRKADLTRPKQASSSP